jgi:hypothetical protein
MVQYISSQNQVRHRQSTPDSLSTALPLFEMGGESSQIRFKYILQRSDPTIPIMPLTRPFWMAYISDISSKELGRMILDIFGA